MPDDTEGMEDRESFDEGLRDEGQHAATLLHPNLVTLLDAGEDEEIGPFLVFEHIAAPSLGERLAQGSLSSIHVSRLARELGSALTHIHDAGFVHRDVSRESVWIAESGAKLGEFGRLGQPSADADAYSDEFTLAAMLYEALVGRPHSLTHDPRVDPRVQLVFSRALHRDKGQRFPSCRAFGEALAAALEDSVPIVTLPADTIPVRLSTVPRATRKTQNMLAGSALAVILLLFFYGRRPDPVPDVPPKKPAVDAHVISTPPHLHERKKDMAVSSDAGPADAERE